VAGALIPTAKAVSFFRNPPGFPKYDDDISVQLNDCTIEVKLKLQFTGPGATLQLADEWVAGMYASCNGMKINVCFNLSLDIDYVVGGAIRADYVQIHVKILGPTEVNRAYATLGKSSLSNDLEGWFNDCTTPVMAAHEMIHWMGGKDDYKDGPDGLPIRTQEAIDEDEAGLPDLMAQIDLNPDGSSPKPKTRHMKQMCAAFGITLPDHCSTCPPSTSPPIDTTTTTTTTSPTTTITTTAPPTATTTTTTTTTTTVPVTTRLTFQHTAPGVYSEVFLDLTGPAQTTVTVTLTGPAVDFPATITTTMGADGTLHLTWTIRQYGTYTASGTVGGQSFTVSVVVQ
jgi:hypothetical protein